MNPTPSALHKYHAPTAPLATFVDGSGPATTKRFRVPIPDSRLRTKITIVFVPIAGQAVDAGNLGVSTLWLYEGEEDRGGQSGTSIPCTNIEGTEAAPTAIATAGLGGYTREFVTAADYIEGVLASTPGGGMIGTWQLQVRIQPDSVRFTDDEWNIIKNKCTPRVAGGNTVVP